MQDSNLSKVTKLLNQSKEAKNLTISLEIIQENKEQFSKLWNKLSIESLLHAPSLADIQQNPKCVDTVTLFFTAISDLIHEI